MGTERKPRNSITQKWDSSIACVATIAAIAAVVAGCQGAGDNSSNGPAFGYASDGTMKCLSQTASVVGFSDTAISVTGNGKIGGGVVLLGHSTLSATGNAYIGDAIYAPSEQAVNLTGKAATGEIVVLDLTPAEQAVINAINDIDNYAVTQHLNGVSGSVTLQGNGAKNVIQIDGDIALAGKDQLVLAGGEDDLFVISVAGDVRLSGQAAIAVQGASPRNVLIRLVGSNRMISVTGQAGFAGTLVAPRGSAQISGNGKLEGSVLAWNTIDISGNGLAFDAAPFCPFWMPKPAPSPSVSSSPTPDPSVSASPTPDPSVSASPTPDPSVSASPTPDPSVSASPTPDPSATVTASPTPDPSATVTASPTPDPSATVTASPTPDPSASPSPLATATPSPTPTLGGSLLGI